MICANDIKKIEIYPALRFIIFSSDIKIRSFYHVRPNTELCLYIHFERIQTKFPLVEDFHSISLLKVINLRGFKHFKRSRLYTVAIVVLLKGFKT